MLKVRCKMCNTELNSGSTKKFCGCSNMMTIHEDTISAVDLSNVVIVEGGVPKKKSGILSHEDIIWQEQRRKRKVRKLDFEIR